MSKIPVPRFDRMPLGTLEAIHIATRVDIFDPTITMPQRLAAYALFVRKPTEPELTMEIVVSTMTMEDFDFPDVEEEPAPNPTKRSELYWPTPTDAVQVP